jgi:hypothetical protein
MNKTSMKLSDLLSITYLLFCLIFKEFHENSSRLFTATRSRKRQQTLHDPLNLLSKGTSAQVDIERC